MNWFYGVVWAALLVAILSAVGPTALGIVWFFLSLMWPGILGGLLSLVCGGTVAGAMLATDDVWGSPTAIALGRSSSAHRRFTPLHGLHEPSRESAPAIQK